MSIDLPQRIAKYLAYLGFCSRRQAEILISQGRVVVDNKILLNPAVKVSSKNKILIDNNPVIVPSSIKTRLWKAYKPRGVLVTTQDPKGRPTIFNTLEKKSLLPRVISVGRLDINSEGLILLTNKGEVARWLELPSTGWARCYQIRVYGHITQSMLDDLAEGIVVDTIHYKPIFAKLERQLKSNSWITVTLNEGKNREIRKIFSYLGCQVNKLIRLSFGPFELGSLKPNQYEEISASILHKHLPSKLWK
ncbi:MAG: rRNA pseudouridine synthase [Alphaproteobacteria bacterium]|nr:rRNA pseudouridine synthase [Alphaproteobacteria bacterium]